ncbi:hypothetical protein L3X38_016953 [Prunus dulcis]|uniref:Uncharacterized protein n=1 Tax=Prunus dulcis TaxID=3755 RepID=A0AAD4W6X2_PRUDU|nr:hypothetical protein L3X38_016947 [Prunus dulcis]KAI5337682.1 hypothetical protein L3X38_016953 [Prunus dulcis]
MNSSQLGTHLYASMMRGTFIILMFAVGTWISSAHARALIDQSPSKHPTSSFLGTENIGSKFFVTKTGLNGNYIRRSKSPPPPPKAAPTPKQTPTIANILEKSPPSSRYISSA